jgi:thiol-disulfide isomerase/thioredoxin
VPLASSEGGAGTSGGANSLVWMKNQYRDALAKARAEGKLVLINFTGYSCTNCHWMKANMFTRPEIASSMQKFVLVELYTDGTDAESEANQKLQLEKFKTVAIPYYAIVDPDEKVVATFPGLTKDSREYLAFLDHNAPASQPAASPSTPAAVATVSSGGGLPAFTPLQGSAPLTAGKVVLVNFWATYCVPCIREIPTFNKLNQEYKSKGLVVLGIGMDEEGAELIKPFLSKHPMDYLVGLGKPVLNEQYKLEGLPVTLVFDRSGKQIKRFDGLTSEPELLSAIQQVL